MDDKKRWSEKMSQHKRGPKKNICPLFKWLGCTVFKWNSKTRPFGIQPIFDHLNTRLARYSDPHCLLQRTIQSIAKRDITRI